MSTSTRSALRAAWPAVAACVASLLGATAAGAAENFTFESTAKAIDGVRVPLTGNPYQGARVFSISSSTTYGDGHKEVTAGKCANWANAPSAQFPQSGVCSVADVYTLRYSCAPAAEMPTESNCWGLLEGVGGRFKGRTGVIAYRSNSTGSVGVGTWR